MPSCAGLSRASKSGVRGFSDLPGRKAILLISDGFKIMDREPLSRTSNNNRTLQKLQQNRSNEPRLDYLADETGGM